jgi:hypothetical protein
MTSYFFFGAAAALSLAKRPLCMKVSKSASQKLNQQVLLVAERGIVAIDFLPGGVLRRQIVVQRHRGLISGLHDGSPVRAP